MPVSKQAEKKLRHDKVRTKGNALKKLNLHAAMKRARKTPNPKNLTGAFSALDKASKAHLIHKNKAARLKSRLSRLVKSTKK